MEESKELSLEQIQAFLEATGEVRFQAQDRAELYGWGNQTLRQQDYSRLTRASKGVVRRYVAKSGATGKGAKCGRERIGGIVSPSATGAPTSNCWRL